VRNVPPRSHGSFLSPARNVMAFIVNVHTRMQVCGLSITHWEVPHATSILKELGSEGAPLLSLIHSRRPCSSSLHDCGHEATLWPLRACYCCHI
jgi:diadenosine tetraphosphatase ApaH/serine/threonine PP2A family protein phosphatase